jgi:putative nucleotidyltransferase with HDIG domain
MQLHEQTVRRLEQLHALRAVDQAISSSRDMRLTLNILLTHTTAQLGVDAADVLLLHQGSNFLELMAGYGFHTLLFESVNLSDSIARRALLEHHPIITIDSATVTLRENPQFGKFWKEEGFACYWGVPLIVKGEVKGVLEVYHRTTFTPDAEWIEFLEALAGQAAIAIDSTQLFENLQRANLDLNLAYDATIEGWSRAMDLRDHETEGHTLRVTDLTLKLARAMRISESELTAIRRGALLHDIGKMGVPDAILLKEGNLTDEEWVLMRQHPQFAHDMLAPITYLKDALNIPYCHHEKWDGTGYPQGLKEGYIPLDARIFAVVDVWDALTNNRTYRKKWTEQKARQYIKEQSGTHFDPQVVDVFLKIIEKG